MIRKIKSKDYKNFLGYCQKFDKYKDFYIGDKQYLFNLKIAKSVFNSCLKKNNIAFAKFQNSEIVGLILIIREEKDYLKISCNSKKDLIDLLQFLSWHFNRNLYLRSKIYNRYLVYSNRNKLEPIFALQKHKFKIIEKNDKEVLMKSESKDRNNYGSN